jgi:RNA polymerase sigma-70 factor (ECF subfamily)
MDKGFETLQELINEYKNSLRLINKGISNVKQKINDLDIHDIDYEIKEDELKNQESLLNSMQRDLQYSIDWITTAREPGSKQGIDNVSALKSY